MDLCPCFKPLDSALLIKASRGSFYKACNFAEIQTICTYMTGNKNQLSISSTGYEIEQRKVKFCG